MFNKGQKVICVDDHFPLGIEKIYTALPLKNTVYTVRDIVPARSWASSDATEVAVYLEELINPTGPAPAYAERGFNVERFAPLTTTSDSQEEVEENLKPEMVPV